MASDSEGLVLELERVLPAPRAAVFEAFTDPDRLRKWWGPAEFTTTEIDYRPRVGETYRIEMQPPEGDAFYLTGEFREVDPPERLAFTFVWEDPDPDDVETVVELTFQELDGTTEVALTQGGFKTQARRQLHRDGWTDTFDKLERHVSAGG